MNNNLLYTWIDVQSQIQNFYSDKSKSTILKDVNYHAYWDGLNISYYGKPNKAKVIKDLNEIFKLRFTENSDPPFIELEGGIKFDVYLEEVENEDDIEQNLVKPILSSYSFVWSTINSEPVSRNNETPNLYAFHSFKGGVGRTLHALAFAIHLIKSNKKVLLIDADFEAPGISWIFSNCDISFADILAMYHGSNDKESVIDLASQVLEKEKVDKLYVLPAFRNLEEKIPFLDITPENIVQFDNDPFVMSKLVSDLGAKLQVDYVVLDLRAGLSELGAPWFFDPNIQKVFVTTLASQALLGTNMMFKSLSNFRQELNLEKGKEILPMLIFSQIPTNIVKEYEENWSDSYSNNGHLGLIRDSYKDAFLNMDDLESSDSYQDLTPNQILGSVLSPVTIFTKEYDSLKSLPNDWNEVRELIERSQLDEGIAKFAFNNPTVHVDVKDWEGSLKKLKEITDKEKFAETSTSSDFFINTSIKNIATTFKSDLPIAVVVGAKGSGKTFLFSQIFFLKYWSKFVDKILNVKQNDSGIILPITIPSNFTNQNTWSKIPESLQAINDNDLSNKNIWLDVIRPDIEKSLQQEFTVSEWRTKWLDYIAWAAGFKIGKANVILDFLEYIKSNKIQIVSIFDGLEDLFKDFNTEKKQQVSTAALLQDVPNWLATQSTKYLGVIVFIRRDLVTSSITQNSGQFLARYQDFELKWVKDEALKLIHWILNQYEIFNQSTIENWSVELSHASEEKLIQNLYKLWGMRMAKDSSNEAYTDKWVLGALANLNKQIQSRDIVRFLHYSSEKSLNNAPNKAIYPDRLLFPSEIKKAIDEVGREKLEEVKVENEPLKKVLNKLEDQSSVLKFPCKKEDLNSFTEKDIDILIENGVVKLHEGEYYMAEIFRKAMKFDYSRKGKPKVLYL
ncbi:MAG: AAA family ATPase [Saprospiraceae bacterium]|nr:AAA family ATPase [Saprospiraceae bacterium]